MNNELIRHELVRTNRNFLTTIIILLAISASVFIVYANDFYNIVYGPFPLEPVKIQSMGKKELADKIVPFTGMSEKTYKSMSQTDIEKLKSSEYTNETAILTTKAYKFDGNKYFGLLKGTPVQRLDGFTSNVDFNYSAYALVPFGDGLILVKATNTDIGKGEFKGVFAPMTDSLEMDIKPLIKPEYRDKVFANVFYAMGSFEITVWNNVFLFFILVAITSFLIFKLIRRYRNPKYHPLYKKISIYGDQDNIIKKINDEYLLKESKIYKNEIVTPSFIIKRNFWRTLITLNDQENKIERKR